MPVSAKIIDFESYRRARVEPPALHSATPHAGMMAGMTGVAWVPVWFMPVYWVGNLPQQN